MGSLLLLLRLEGPLQSWGLRARWDVRDTGDEPSKSAVIGLLGCALGYPMHDPRLEQLDDQLRMGVRVERAGNRTVDFQTVSGVIPTAEGGVKGSLNDPSTIVSPRTYLQDAAFLVVLAGPAEVLKQCQAALMQPCWPIYLGRKACVPSRPVLEDAGLTEAYDSLEDALRRRLWDWEGRCVLDEEHELPTSLRCALEDSGGTALRPDRLRVNPARMYDSRAVRTFSTEFPGAKPREEAQAVCTSPD